MLNSKILGTLAGLILVSTPAAAMEMPHSTSGRGFESIEQPAGLKVGVTIGGLALIGLELWWFLGSGRSRSRAAGASKSPLK